VNIDYFIASRGAKYCLYVYLSTRTSQKQHVQTSLNFLYMLHVAVARSFSDNNAICYVLLFLWMTSCLPIIDRQRRR